jgi:hypothetical protein
MSHILSLRSLWRPGAALVLLPMLSSCGGGYDCSDCNSGYPPVEMSAGVIAADFNGDGEVDILVQNTSGGRVIWLMNGTNFVSLIFLGEVSTSWNIRNY